MGIGQSQAPPHHLGAEPALGRDVHPDGGGQVDLLENLQEGRGEIRSEGVGALKDSEKGLQFLLLRDGAIANIVPDPDFGYGFSRTLFLLDAKPRNQVSEGPAKRPHSPARFILRPDHPEQDVVPDSFRPPGNGPFLLGSHERASLETSPRRRRALMLSVRRPRQPNRRRRRS